GLGVGGGGCRLCPGDVAGLVVGWVRVPALAGRRGWYGGGLGACAAFGRKTLAGVAIAGSLAGLVGCGGGSVWR
ncbi:MAG: hypothetical protein QOE58_2889, partial [Actinomycetota bacterium]|nr:hypothetical protein [Actinomycetota bacterium]